MLNIEPFLTAYDPSDLPGGSVDPLGFERGYAFLAEKILPGLTLTANRPRYFSMMAGGVVLADQSGKAGSTTRERLENRTQTVMRLERFWTVANVLAAAKASGGSLDTTGIRGVRYAQARAARLTETAASETDADFRLLSRQVAHGAIGLYGSVADQLRIFDRDTLALTPDLGSPLGESFLAETNLPRAIRQAVETDGSVSLKTLTKWGEQSHISGATQSGEQACFRDSLQLDVTRWRMVELLRTHRSQEGEPELTRLNRIADALEDKQTDPDIAEALQVILAYEQCYRLVLLGFMRLLWACQYQEPFWVSLSSLPADKVLAGVQTELKVAFRSLHDRLERAKTEAFRLGMNRLEDACRFLRLAAAAPDVTSLGLVIVERHSKVQRAKLNGGRPKMPWLEVVDQRILPTVGRSLQVSHEPADLDSISAHGYRTRSADALIAAAGLA